MPAKFSGYTVCAVTPFPLTVCCSVAELVAERIVTDSQKAIAQSFESSCAPEDILVLTASSPVFSPSLQCASMLINVSLRRLVLALEEANREREEEVGVANEPGSCKTDEERTKDYKELQVNFYCVKKLITV